MGLMEVEDIADLWQQQLYLEIVEQTSTGRSGAKDKDGGHPEDPPAEVVVVLVGVEVALLGCMALAVAVAVGCMDIPVARVEAVL